VHVEWARIPKEAGRDLRGGADKSVVRPTAALHCTEISSTQINIQYTQYD